MADSNELLDVAGAGELDPRQAESGLEAPRKPRTKKQREAFARCREALKKKKETKAAPKQEPALEPEPEPEPSKEAHVLATKPRGPRGPYRKQPKVYACPDCKEEFKDRFAKTNHRRRGHCTHAEQAEEYEEEQPRMPASAFYFNIV